MVSWFLLLIPAFESYGIYDVPSRCARHRFAQPPIDGLLPTQDGVDSYYFQGR